MKIDKSKWKEYELGRLCNLKAGAAISASELSPQYSKGLFPCFGGNGLRGYIAKWSNEGKYVIIGRQGALCGNVNIANDKFYATEHAVVTYPKEPTDVDFLYYMLKAANLNQYATGFAQPGISVKIINKVSVVVPPLTEQKAIASELNTLQSLITQYREQLNDYDKLAQSIFHEMFGDVIINEKGWTCNPFHKLFSLKSGDGLTAKQQISGDFLVYGGNGINGSHTQYNKDGEYIIIGRVGAYCGNVRYVSGKFWLTDNAFELKEKLNPQNKYYLQYLLQKLNLGHYAHKAAQPVISNTVLKDIPIPLPPLPLQQQFASRIESIEAQKALIKQQLADAQTLFDSRMQYYFD